MAAADRDDKGYPPIVTVCLSDHLPGDDHAELLIGARGEPFEGAEDAGVLTLWR